MGDRAWAEIRIGGPVRRSAWKDVKKALRREFSEDYKITVVEGLVLVLEDAESSGGFEDLQRVLRETGTMKYVVTMDGYFDQWPAQRLWWDPGDPERGREDLRSFYNTCGERVTWLVNGTSLGPVPVMSVDDVRAAFDAALQEFAAHGQGSLDAYLRERVVQIGCPGFTLEPISVIEG